MPAEEVTMTSIHHDLDLLSRFDGSVTVSQHGSLGSKDLHEERRGVRADVTQRLTRFVDLVLTWHERARQRRALLRLDDRMLSDIGVDRGTARMEGQKPFWRP
jgi:uncharacterized protein YjiS (DUF1127 family)